MRGAILSLALLVSTSLEAAFAQSTPETLRGTERLEDQGDLSLEMQAKVGAFFDRLTSDSVESRERLWKRDYSSRAAYEKSIQENRERFAQIIGLADQRLPIEDLRLEATLTAPSLVAETESLKVYSVSWPVLPGVDGEGLLLEPTGTVRAQVVVLPDADFTPEQALGLRGNDSAQFTLASRLAAAGCRVIVPVLIDRDFSYSGNPRVRLSNQPHREFICRQAYFMGRHIIGFEVQKIQSALDYFEKRAGVDPLPIGIAGYGEGALLALYAAAVDLRVDAAFVSGYFDRREELWKEPIYRNVWGLLYEFGDAGIASLIAPRSLVVEACRGPEIPGPPPPRNGVNHAAPGSIKTPRPESVRLEFERAADHYRKLGLENHIQLVLSGGGEGLPGSREAAAKLAAALRLPPGSVLAEPLALRTQPGVTDFARGGAKRQERQVRQLVEYCQKPNYLNPYPRAAFWKEADWSSVERWQATTEKYREYFWKEIVGWLRPASLPPHPRSRIAYQTPGWKGYEVVLDVWPEVTAYGILLVPSDIQPGEKRPVVVAQHGRGGRPQDVCDPSKKDGAYHAFAASLADLGFVVFAPQNLYIGEENYRILQRKANPLKQTFFSVMVRQHEQILKWLSGLSFVDSSRIGFYGLSYGGKSAMFLPAIVQGYALSICSGDFNEEVWKHVSIEEPFTFILTNEYEHTEFDFGPKFNYGELAGLIAPRPFMVERGHNDGVSVDEWVAYEYAKVRRLYARLGIPDRTEIEYFMGPHEINGRGSFLFLQKHLRWNQGREGMLR